MRIDFENPWLLALAVVVPLALIVLRFTLVDSPRVQFALSALTRCVIQLLVVLGLGSLLWVSRSEKLSVLVLADLSDSVAESAPRQVSNYWAQVKMNLSSGRQASLVTFAATNETIAPWSGGAGTVVKKPVSAGETAMERALVTGWGAMPPDS